MKNLAVVLLSVLFAGLSSQIAFAKWPPTWEMVVVTDDDSRVENCEEIGEVKGSSGWGGVAQNVGEGRAYKAIKRNAFEKGADTVLVLSENSGWGGARYRGYAYRCGEPTKPPIDPEEFIILGGVHLCSPAGASIEYLKATPLIDSDPGDSIERHAFEVPIDLQFSGVKPNRGEVLSLGGRIAQVEVSWDGLPKKKQKSVWEELYSAFIESKGQPNSTNGKDLASWSEQHDRKLTKVFRDKKQARVAIRVICRDKALLAEKVDNVDKAF